MKLRRRRFLGGSAAALTTGCNLGGGYSNLGEPLDPLESLGTDGHTTWVRTTNETIEWWLFSGIELESDEPGQFFHSVYQLGRGESSTESGEYERDLADGRIELTATSRWVNPDEADTPILQRGGAFREDISIRRTMSFDVTGEEGETWATFRGDENQRLLHFDSLMRRIRRDSVAGAAYFLWLYFMSVDGAHWRIPGFGGLSESMYFGRRTQFSGIVEGHLILELRDALAPKNITEYYQQEDLSGVELLGRSVDSADAAGDGFQSGTVLLNFTPFAGQGEEPDESFVPYTGPPELQGEVYLGNDTGTDGGILVTGGSPSSGVYRVNLDGNRFEVRWDFRGTYPIAVVLDPREGRAP